MRVVEAKVAAVLSESKLAFNIGSDAGVKTGGRALVQRRVTVTDPDTQEELGTVMITVLTLRITQVEPRFCVGDVTDVTGQQSGIISSVFINRPRKKIVATSFEETAGESVFVGPSDPAYIEIEDQLR